MPLGGHLSRIEEPGQEGTHKLMNGWIPALTCATRFPALVSMPSSTSAHTVVADRKPVEKRNTRIADHPVSRIQDLLP